MDNLLCEKFHIAYPRGIDSYNFFFFFLVTQKESNFWLNSVFVQSSHLLSVENSGGRTEISSKVFI